MLRWVTLVVALLALVAVAGLPVFVFPHSDRPARADAVIVLGPSTPDRIALATRLVDEGYAPHAYVSMPSDMIDLSPCATANVTCFTPSPTTTRGEARFTLDSAHAHGWSSVIVVTAQFHVSRARYIFDRCGGVDVRVVSVHERLSPFGWIHQYGYQTGAFIKAVIVGCAAG